MYFMFLTAITDGEETLVEVTDLPSLKEARAYVALAKFALRRRIDVVVQDQGAMAVYNALEQYGRSQNVESLREVSDKYQLGWFE